MTSPQKTAAVRIARSLRPAEEALNVATLRMLAVGTAVLSSRADGTFHPLEGQIAVERIGAATMKAFDLMTEFGQVHRELRKLGEAHRVIGEGDVFQTPDPDAPRGMLGAPELVPAIATAA